MRNKILFLKRTAWTFCTAAFSIAIHGQNTAQIMEVPFTQVRIQDAFWSPRIETNRTVSIPSAFRECEKNGRFDNFAIAGGLKEGEHRGDFSFDDTDPYKIIEGASYSLAVKYDARLDAYLDSVIALIAAAQESDGYLTTCVTNRCTRLSGWWGTHRWEKINSHELYNSGHLYEAAVAHYRATGKRSLLDVAIKNADLVCRVFGPDEGQKHVPSGHPIVEMALAKLYKVTGKEEYLRTARYFVEETGRCTDGHAPSAYSQDHKPILEQNEIVGHAVRATYMYAGMADVAALTGDTAYIHAIDRIWDNIVSKKYYITGGIGATANGEAFGANYELPNMSAYCETCAAIGNVYVNYRLFLLHGESKYYDVLERSLYNGLISGVSLDGGGFFYPNPLESRGQHQRQPWFGCACCPSNICRFIPSLPGYVYAVKDKDVYVNLFMSNEANLEVGKKSVVLEQQTRYPWDGDVAVSVKKNKAGEFAMKIRIPGWVRGQVVPSDLYRYSDGKRLGYSVKVNGQPVESELQDGYFTIERRWKKGDKVEVHFDMEPRVVKAHAKVEADRGRVAVERGPLVYCAEWPDNDFDIMSVLVNRRPQFETVEKPDLLCGLTEIKTGAQVLGYDAEGRLTASDVELTLIPYYAWAHRGSGNMMVWLPQEVSATSPSMSATLASESRVDASHKTTALSAINDRLVPVDENDRSMAYYHWWPMKNSTEWITYEFPKPSKVSSSTVYWFDDEPWGGCRVPQSWKLYYKDEQGGWTPVSAAGTYGTKKGVPNTVEFTLVQTTAMKLEVVLPKDNSAGVFEWEVE